MEEERSKERRKARGKVRRNIKVAKERKERKEIGVIENNAGKEEERM